MLSDMCRGGGGVSEGKEVKGELLATMGWRRGGGQEAKEREEGCVASEKPKFQEV